MKFCVDRVKNLTRKRTDLLSYVRMEFRLGSAIASVYVIN